MAEKSPLLILSSTQALNGGGLPPGERPTLETNKTRPPNAGTFSGVEPPARFMWSLAGEWEKLTVKKAMICLLVYGGF